MDNWRKSRRSNANGGNCVEAASGTGLVSVRDTADRGGVALSFSATAWQEFLSIVKLQPQPGTPFGSAATDHGGVPWSPHRWYRSTNSSREVPR